MKKHRSISLFVLIGLLVLLTVIVLARYKQQNITTDLEITETPELETFHRETEKTDNTILCCTDTEVSISTPPVTEEPVIEDEQLEPLDEPVILEEQPIIYSAAFTATHYCGCQKCCGQYSDGHEDIAYGCRGDLLTAYVSIAADPRVIPYGTMCWDSDGNTYIVQDVGGGINGNRIDIFVGSHTEALNLGVKTITLFWEVE